MEIVYKRCPREKLLTEEGLAEYFQRSGNAFSLADTPRNDPVLVAMVKEANAGFVPPCADVRICELADGTVWHIRGGGRRPEWVAIDG